MSSLVSGGGLFSKRGRRNLQNILSGNPVLAPLNTIMGGDEPETITPPAAEPTPLMPIPDEAAAKIKAQKGQVSRRRRKLTRANTILSDTSQTGLGG